MTIQAWIFLPSVASNHSPSLTGSVSFAAGAALEVVLIDGFAPALGDRRWFAMTTKGACRVGDDAPAFASDDVFLFGPESRGLPAEVLEQFPTGRRLRLPMRAGQRSLNLSNAVAVTVFEAWRQLGYAGAA